VTSNRDKMGLRYKPMAFTQQGVAMFTPLNACPVEFPPSGGTPLEIQQGGPV